MSMLSENEEMLTLAPQGVEQPTYHLLFKFKKSNSKLIKKTSKGLKTWGANASRRHFNSKKSFSIFVDLFWRDLGAMYVFLLLCAAYMIPRIEPIYQFI